MKDPGDRFRTQGRKITDTGQDRDESLGVEAERAAGEGRIHTDVPGLADDLHRKFCAAQPRLEGGLITDDQHMRQRATQRRQGVQRHRPGEPAPQGIGYRESRLRILGGLECDHRGGGGACRHLVLVSPCTLLSSSLTQWRTIG